MNVTMQLQQSVPGFSDAQVFGLLASYIIFCVTLFLFYFGHRSN